MANIGRSFFEGQRAQQQFESSQKQSALADLALEQQKQQFATQQREQGASDEMRRLKFMNNAGRALLGVNPQQRIQAFEKLIPAAQSVGIDPSQFSVDQLTDENLQQLVSSTATFLQNPQQLTASLQERQALINDLQGGIDQETGQLKPREQLTPTQLSAAINLGLEAREVGSAAQTIAQKGNVENVAEVERTLAGAKETGKQEVKLEFEPKIKEAIKLAESRASAQGESAVDHARAVAALPGIEQVVSKLKILSEDATFTLGGKAFNEVAKQFGFTTSGANSRASMISIVDNQVLPLLKPIFGAAFTEAEGDRLRNSLLDPDASAEARKAQLDAFLEQMKRNIETKAREVQQLQGSQAQQFTEGQTAFNPQTGERVIFKNGQWVRIDG